ncbi:MAG: nucleotide sugar dehydrogenase [Gemmatimonadota bacterium]|jgi:UDP-N-acetyl-D-glucosamine dehydrogenase
MTNDRELGTLLDRIGSKTARCGVLGLGYVGLPLAVEFARQGFETTGFDVSEPVVAGLNEGRSHIPDIADADLAPLVSAGRFRATTGMKGLAECDVISICVPTPLSKTRDPDVSFVVAATESVAATLRPGQVVILESTTYPGTTRELMLPMLEAGGLRAGRDFFLCFSPERVDPGNTRWHIRNTPKVIGGVTPACVRAGAAVYGQVMEHLVTVSSTESAELAKLLENTFRAVNIALVNEMAQVSDRLGVDVFEVIEAAASKPFGFQRFDPGPGIGGHCIPLDPQYLAWKMRTLNYKTRLIDLASEVNSEMPRWVVTKVQDALNDRQRALNGSRILILGIAYKRDVDDVRESPALDVIGLLEAKGARVDYHDPFVPSTVAEGERRQSVPFTRETVASYDCVVITTDHSVVDYDLLRDADVLVVDTRNAMRDRRGPNVVGLSGAPDPPAP